MKKKIEDYLHLYLGAIEVQCPKLSGWPYSQKRHPFERHFWLSNWEKKLIPILRPLSDLSMDEAKEFFQTGASSMILNKRITKSGVLFEYSWVSDNPKRNNADGWSYSQVGISFAPQLDATGFQWLLSKGFDLFNLIPDGLAIDSTTLK